MPGADVVVHAEPLALSDHDITTQVRILAARRGLGAHAIRLYDENSQRWLELHLEVPESLTLEEAHRQATLFENDVRAGVPGMMRIVSHLEPVGDNTAIRLAEPADAAEVLAAVDEFFHGDASVAQLHNVKVQRAGGKTQVSFHCRLDPQMLIGDCPRSDRGPGGPHPRPRAERGTGGDSRGTVEGVDSRKYRQR